MAHLLYPFRATPPGKYLGSVSIHVPWAGPMCLGIQKKHQTLCWPEVMKAKSTGSH